MTVSRDYLMKQPSGPSAPKLFLDTRVVPRAVNIAGAMEVALDRAATRTGLRPAVLLAGGSAAACLMLYSLWRDRHDAPAIHGDRSAGSIASR